MRLKRPKKFKDDYVRFRCKTTVKNALQRKANIYTEGNLSEYLIFAGLNFVAGGEDFEDEDTKPTKRIRRT